MSEREPSLDSVFQGAAEFAAAGDWSGVYAALADVAVEAILESPVTAYRFAEALYHTGQMRELRSFADQYVSEARATSDTTGVLRALNLAGIAAFELGDIDVAEARWDELLGLADGSGDRDMMARAANNLGAVANLRGHSNQAVVFYRLALPLYQRLGQRRGLAQTYHNLGVSQRDLERYDEATSTFASAIQVAEEIPYPPVIAMTLISRAELEVRRSDFQVATELASRGLALARGLDDPISEGEALRVRGLARSLSGAVAEAVREMESALDLARQTGNKLLEAETLRDLGALSSDDDETAHARLTESLHCFEALGATAEADRIRALNEKLFELQTS